jgi:hypothetical protein
MAAGYEAADEKTMRAAADATTESYRGRPAAALHDVVIVGAAFFYL